jgi:hypothetical protein
MRTFFAGLTAMVVLFLSATQVQAATQPPIDPPGKVTGVQASAYRGEYYIPSQEPYRKCVAQREGRHQYWVTGSNGFYLGTYQMTHALARGAVWMMGPELKRMFGKERGKQIRQELHATKPTKWGRFYWDMAFYTILNYEHPASGQHHWRGGRFSCTVGMTTWGGAR